MVSSARAASTSSQDWKRAPSVNGRHVELVDPQRGWLFKHVVPHHVVDADDVAQAMPVASSWKLKTTLRRKKSLGNMSSPAFAGAGPPPSRGQAIEPVNRLAVALAGLTRAQREHRFRHPVDHAQKGAGRILRQ